MVKKPKYALQPVKLPGLKPKPSKLAKATAEASRKDRKPKLGAANLTYMSSGGELKIIPDVVSLWLNAGPSETKIQIKKGRMPGSPDMVATRVEILPQWAVDEISADPAGMVIDIPSRTTMSLQRKLSAPLASIERLAKIAEAASQQYRRITRKLRLSKNAGLQFPLGCKCGEHKISYSGGTELKGDNDVAATCRTFTEAMERLQMALMLYWEFEYEAARHCHSAGTITDKDGLPLQSGNPEPNTGATFSAEPVG